MADRTEYGRFEAISERDDSGYLTTVRWSVDTANEPPIEIGTGSDGKKLARTLAAALDAADVDGWDCLPPGFADGERPESYDSGTWEAWAADSLTVPARVAASGKAPLAAYLKVVHRKGESWIAKQLDVSEATVRQYLSDLRRGVR
jgi:hypothetical protein